MSKFLISWLMSPASCATSASFLASNSLASSITGVARDEMMVSTATSSSVIRTIAFIENLNHPDRLALPPLERQDDHVPDHRSCGLYQSSPPGQGSFSASTMMACWADLKTAPAIP